MKMKVRDFIKEDFDIDVYDDVCESLAIAFVGPMALTPAGEKKFSEVLDYDVELHGALDSATVCVDSVDDKTWKRRLRKAKEFFEAAAGYCAADDYDRWFSSGCS